MFLWHLKKNQESKEKIVYNYSNNVYEKKKRVSLFNIPIPPNKLYCHGWKYKGILGTLKIHVPSKLLSL